MMRSMLLSLATLLLLSGPSTLKAQAQPPVTIVSKPVAGAFPLAGSNNAAPLFFDAGETKVIGIASKAFADDVQRVTGLRPAIRNDQQPVAKYAVIAGTIGQSNLIDKLISSKKISVDSIRNKWETFLIAVVDQPFAGMEQALVVAGSDRRGTAFGLFELSGMMGVSPLYWWADVHPEKKQALYITKGSSLIGPPSVKYRGIFINDEMWGLAQWSAKHLDKDVQSIGPKTYEKVFELLLRLKANYIWPAMFYETKPFYYFPGNPQTADDYAIVVGSSHCEQMLRNNISEWDVFFEEEYKEKKGAWRYDLNKTQIHRYWNDRVKQSKNYESTYMIGMRGVGDSDMPGSATKEEKIALWNNIVRDQRAMLEEHTGKAASEVPQLFCPYNEVLDWYRTGKMEIPEDISMLWVDDNHGYVRQLPTSNEQQRTGGHGMYYHFSYLGPPESFIWLSTVAPALTSYEMTKSYAYGADKLWIFNVGDIKPAEMEIELAMEMAWDINKWTPEKAYLFPRYWAAKTFGETWADEIGKIKHEFFLLANSGKPEYMIKTPVTTEEAENKIRRYEQLAKATTTLGKKIPSRLKDAWYQLIEYPVLGSYYMNQKSWYARKSVMLAKYGDAAALQFAAKAKKAHEEIGRITRRYNKEIANGKWDGIMVEQIKARWFNMSMPPVATDSSLAAAKSQPLVAAPAEAVPFMISAASYTSKKDKPGYTLNGFKGLGISGEGISIMPFTAPPISDSAVESAPYLEYTTRLVLGYATILAKFLPTHAINSKYKLRYGISVNGSKPQVINIEGADQWRKGWSTNVLRGYNAGETKHRITQPGESIIRIYLLDPGLVLDELAIY
ncbi:glycosyl hydrolase 115 family protein [Pseudobacter ginsenosidimutans]|uniref:Glycosyl hydrolase family 115 (Putative glucuronidase) n=1 Tax=Pseudobacter ginsenosidimutans TaxID=661488 RepID=A0A4Q7MC90_9BACT|nr:glycosyl hydrolase 115 family protein [Pseudobacter ginsenosidimutans]QEC42592.1 hypothetical protein FSB84_13145 [Pseudobacter ginsenosidimutans]RZS63919.1 glycosyl hydrolase family 115 (putative glucuronidase) [Pseudobacter ginsenosidimutans]